MVAGIGREQRDAPLGEAAGDGALAIDDFDTAQDPPAAAVVELLDNDYIRLLHPEPAAPAAGTPTYRLAGDPAALGAVLACLS